MYASILLKGDKVKLPNYMHVNNILFIGNGPKVLFQQVILATRSNVIICLFFF